MPSCVLHCSLVGSYIIFQTLTLFSFWIKVHLINYLICISLNLMNYVFFIQLHRTFYLKFASSDFFLQAIILRSWRIAANKHSRQVCRRTMQGNCSIPDLIVSIVQVNCIVVHWFLHLIFPSEQTTKKTVAQF